MIAGVALIAVATRRTLVHVDDPLELVSAVALLGGAALYLLAHVAFRLRNMHTLSVRRLLCAIVLLALIAAGIALPALVTMGIAAAVLCALIVYEACATPTRVIGFDTSSSRAPLPSRRWRVSETEKRL